ncbi:hypothetical protein CRYUN_Cryun27aG0020800 [Craigia yunnanensis]
MPDVVAHTTVIEAYASAGRCKEALKCFLRILASWVASNAYTYSVLIKGLATDDAKHLVVFEAFARMEKVDEAKEFLGQMKEKGFVPDEKDVKEVPTSKRGPALELLHLIFFSFNVCGNVKERTLGFVA